MFAYSGSSTMVRTCSSGRQLGRANSCSSGRRIAKPVMPRSWRTAVGLHNGLTPPFEPRRCSVNERYERGLEIRRAVLGAEYVDAALASADELSRPLQELVTEYCWGEVWGRPGL